MAICSCGADMLLPSCIGLAWMYKIMKMRSASYLSDCCPLVFCCRSSDGYQHAKCLLRCRRHHFHSSFFAERFIEIQRGILTFSSTPLPGSKKILSGNVDQASFDIGASTFIREQNQSSCIGNRDSDTPRGEHNHISSWNQLAMIFSIRYKDRMFNIWIRCQ